MRPANLFLASALTLLLSTPAFATPTSVLKAGAYFSRGEVVRGLDKVTEIVAGLQTAKGVTSAGIYTTLTGNALLRADADVQSLLTAARAGQLELDHPKFQAYPQLVPLMEYLASEYPLDMVAADALAKLFSEAGVDDGARRMAGLCAGALDTATLRFLSAELGSAAYLVGATRTPAETAKRLVDTHWWIGVPFRTQRVFTDPGYYATRISGQSQSIREELDALRRHLEAGGDLPRAWEGDWTTRDAESGRIVGYGQSVRGDAQGLHATWFPNGQVQEVYIRGTGDAGQTRDRLRFEFRADGTMKRAELRFTPIPGLTNGRELIVAYDTQGRLQSMTFKSPGGTERTVSYTPSGAVLP